MMPLLRVLGQWPQKLIYTHLPTFYTVHTHTLCFVLQKEEKEQELMPFSNISHIFFSFYLILVKWREKPSSRLLLAHAQSLEPRSWVGSEYQCRLRISRRNAKSSVYRQLENQTSVTKAVTVGSTAKELHLPGLCTFGLWTVIRDNV